MNTAMTRRNARAFTLLETMLAALLGTVIIGATMGLFGAMQRADRDSQSRALTTGDMTLLHRTCARALRTLVMNVRPGVASSIPMTAKQAPGQPVNENTPDRRPRIILEPDGVTGMQRLEICVAEPPIYGRDTGAGNAYGASRGAFELRPSEPPDTYSMHWISYLPGDTADKPGPVRQDITIATGISRCQWRFMKTGEGGRLEARTTLTVADWATLPAYAELDLTMADGRPAKWMFELQWTIAAEPGVVLAATDRLGPNNRPTSSTNSGRGNNPSASDEDGDKPGGRGDRATRFDKPIEPGADASFEAREQYLRQVEAYERAMYGIPPRQPKPTPAPR